MRGFRMVSYSISINRLRMFEFYISILSIRFYKIGVCMTGGMPRFDISSYSISIYRSSESEKYICLERKVYIGDGDAKVGECIRGGDVIWRGLVSE